MSENNTHDELEWGADAVPGDEPEPHNVPRSILIYLIGLGLAILLTATSFWVASGTSLLYVAGVPMALAALAIGQMGVHLAFFLHLTTGPDNTNNILALAFGVMIVGIVIGGSLWIMYHLNANMVMPSLLMNLHTQP
jgi:cytochrome o ubiquinol oxidase subunit IV